MGTNYYLRKNKNSLLVKEFDASKPYDELHIGKSSAGWCFLVRTHPDLGIKTLKDWKEEFKVRGVKIFDEYDNEVSVELMMEVITDRKGNPENVKEFTPTYLSRNHAEIGPFNLLRHVPNDGFCTGQGAGTWDYSDREFS